MPPAVGIAAELKARGHAIRFLGHARQQPALATGGFEIAPTTQARPFSALQNNSLLPLIAVFGDRGFGRDAWTRWLPAPLT